MLRILISLGMVNQKYILKAGNFIPFSPGTATFFLLSLRCENLWNFIPGSNNLEKKDSGIHEILTLGLCSRIQEIVK